MAPDAPKVFCKDCKYLYEVKETIGPPDTGGTQKTLKCRVAQVTYHPIKGEIRHPSDPELLNRNFDCPHFTPPGAERIRPGRRSDSIIFDRSKLTLWQRFVQWFMELWE